MWEHLSEEEGEPAPWGGWNVLVTVAPAGPANSPREGTSFLELWLPLLGSLGENNGNGILLPLLPGGPAPFLRAPPKGMLSSPGCVVPAGKNDAWGLPGEGFVAGADDNWAGAGREWVGGSFQNSSGLLASISVLFPDFLRGSPLWSRPLRGPWELRENKPDSDSPETGPRGPGLPILGRAADHLNSIRCLASPPSRSCCLSRARGCLATPLSRRLDGCALPFVSAGIGSHGVA